MSQRLRFDGCGFFARGISIVEVLIVVAATGIIATIALPRFSRGDEPNQRVRTQAELRRIRNAFDTFCADAGSVRPLTADQAVYVLNTSNTLTTELSYRDKNFAPYLRSVSPNLLVGRKATHWRTPQPAPEFDSAEIGWIAKLSGETITLGYIDPQQPVRCESAWCYP